jgi:predicted lipoprotein with Yx(FWY)xxD motif
MLTSPHRPATTNRSQGRHRRRLALAGSLAAAAMTFAACGSDASVPITESAAEAPAGTTAQPAANNDQAISAAATIGEGDLGPMLAGDNGLTLYGFTNDVEAASTCYGTCADAWPPVIVDADFTVAPGLDVGIFATTERDDGSLQLVAGKWPLYFFAGDAVPGDLAGQGSGDVWFAVGLDGKLLTGAPEAAAGADTGSNESATDDGAGAAPVVVGVGETSAGSILVDPQGLSLYGFTEDSDGLPTCDGACADAWPPLTVDGPDLPAGLDAEVFSVVERNDGTFQLKAGKWPLYLFAGDGAPGDINGQGSGDVWFLADPNGGLITGDNAAATAADDQDDTDTEAAEDDGY